MNSVRYSFLLIGFPNIDSLLFHFRIHLTYVICTLRQSINLDIACGYINNAHATAVSFIK